MRENADARLAAILEKGSSSLNEGDVAAFVLKYTDYPARKMSLLGILYNYPLLSITFVIVLLVLLFTGVMMIFVARKRRFEKKSNQQLRKALLSAERANSAKSVFMSRMSHEIRTPLNAIIGYTAISSDALADVKCGPECRQAAAAVKDCLSKSAVASRHLLTVINDVLDMSAIESGKMKLAHGPFDLKEMLTALTAMFRSIADAKASTLTRPLSNLLKNVLSATRCGSTRSSPTSSPTP